MLTVVLESVEALLELVEVVAAALLELAEE